MINGYVTYDELKLITGFSDKFLKSLLLKGMTRHEISIETKTKKELTQELFNLDEVQKWITTHIF